MRDRVLAVLQRAADRARGLDWATHYVDGTVVRAHQHAAGAGRWRSYCTVANGTSRCTSGALLAAGAVHRPGRGRPRVYPEQLVGDKGYSYPAVRRVLAGRRIRAVIPRRRDQRPADRRHRPFDRETYRGRKRLERLINRLKQCRRIATRYEKRAVHYLTFIVLRAILLWL